MAHEVEIVVIEEERAVREIVVLKVLEVCKVCRVSATPVQCDTVASGRAYVEAPLPQSRKDQALLARGEVRKGQLLIIDGKMTDGNADELAAEALSRGKVVVRVTGDAHSVPHAVVGAGVLWKPLEDLVLTDVVSSALRVCLGM